MNEGGNLVLLEEYSRDHTKLMKPRTFDVLHSLFTSPLCMEEPEKSSSKEKVYIANYDYYENCVNKLLLSYHKFAPGTLEKLGTNSRKSLEGKVYRQFQRGVEKIYDCPDKSKIEVVAFLVQAQGHFWTVYMFKEGDDTDPS